MTLDGYLTVKGSSYGSVSGLTKDQLLQCAYRPVWVWLRGTLVTVYWLVWFAMLIAAVLIIKSTPKCNGPPPLDWWQRSPIYQIEVASFSDGGQPMDGQGDIAGLASRLEYIEKLGVRTVCLSPIFNSPIREPRSVIDFRSVAPHFGTLGDFKSLMMQLKEKDMKLILDFIPNHTSNKHQWFQRSIKKEGPFTDYYIWSKPGGEDSNQKPLPPNDWISARGELAWEWNEDRQEFYLHQFSKDQPDLNYGSSELIREIKDVLSFWLTLGVSGFRLRDVSRLMGDAQGGHYSFNKQRLEILHQFRKLMGKHSSDATKVLLVEDQIPIQALPLYYGNATKPLAHLAISTEFSTAIHRNISAEEMFNNVQMWMDNFPGGACPNWMVGNENVQRLASRVGPSLADGISMLVSLLPGTPLAYYGDEIGMEDVNDTEEYLGKAECHELSNSPMQWNSSKHAGFSSANHTWLPINENYHTVNVDVEERAAWSHLKVYRALVQARKSEAVMNGQTELQLLGRHVFAYTRIKKGVPGILVAANFDDQVVTVDLTAMKYVPTASSILTFSTNYAQSNYKVRSKIRNTSLVLPGKGGVVLLFVPNFPNDASNGSQ